LRIPVGDDGPKDEWSPPIFSGDPRAACANRFPHSPAPPVAFAILDPAIISSVSSTVFHELKEMRR